MDAREEAVSLREDPLPPVAIKEPLTLVWTLDKQIEALQDQLNALMEQRQQAFQYAIDQNIERDTLCELKKEEKGRKTRTLNLPKFKEVFPAEFQLACNIERREIEERLTHVGEKVPLGVVDKLVKKGTLEAAPGVLTVTEMVSMSYTVVRHA
jgi:hypothetical protein